MDKKDIIRAIKNGSGANEILAKLNSDDRLAVEKMLNDSEATKKLLNTPEAQALYKALFGGNKNE